MASRRAQTSSGPTGPELRLTSLSDPGLIDRLYPATPRGPNPAGRSPRAPHFTFPSFSPLLSIIDFPWRQRREAALGFLDGRVMAGDGKFWKRVPGVRLLNGGALSSNLSAPGVNSG